MDIQEIHAQNHQKVDSCQSQWRELGIVSRSQLWKFVQNVNNAWAEMDKEFVACRRTGRITTKYTELESKFLECVTVYEQWLVMAALMHT